jgi:hypothetical protein
VRPPQRSAGANLKDTEAQYWDTREHISGEGLRGVKTAAVCAPEPAAASSSALRPILITYTFIHDPHRREDFQAYTDVRAQHPPTYLSV